MTRRRSVHHFCQGVVLVLLSFVLVHPVYALEWSKTELHFQYGNLAVPTFAGGGDAEHFIYTLQHASGWQYGDNLFFCRHVLDAQEFGVSGFRRLWRVVRELESWQDHGSEDWRRGRFRRRRDSRVQLGSRSQGIKKYLPGLRLALDLSGFTFANLDFTAYIDDSDGVAAGGAPSESNSFMIDFNFMRPFTIGGASFSIEGHAEYIGERENEFGGTVESWIFAQPQLRWNAHDRFSLGIEYQFWMNKLGDGATDESVVQALFVWKF